MDRLDRVRREVDSILLRLVSDEDRRCGFVHLYGVAHSDLAGGAAGTPL